MDVREYQKNKKLKKIKEEIEERKAGEKFYIIPPSILRIKNSIIDLDSVNKITLVEDNINSSILLSMNNETSEILLKDLNFIYEKDEFICNHEYKCLVNDKHITNINFCEPDSEYSKCEEFENFFNFLVKCKGIRKLYLETKNKVFYGEYSFHSMIKDIHFVDVNKSVTNLIYQHKYKVNMNSMYGIRSNRLGFIAYDEVMKCKNKKNRRIKYIEDK
jgi:hypothetical protein